MSIILENAIILLGDPGAGKTTFLKFLALKLARGEGAEMGLAGRLPILLPLAAYANALHQDQAVRLDDFIAAYFTDIGCDLPVAHMLGEALREGRALILLDGLDEVKDLRQRMVVIDRVVDFFAFHHRKGNKFVLTSRVVGYRPVRTAAEDLLEATLVDFDEEEIDQFVQRWTAALEKQAQGDTGAARLDAEQERRELMNAVRTNEGVRRLAANPLLLTILALMKRKGVTLPERRVELYDQYITTLISTWNRARTLGVPAPGRDPDVVQTVRILAPLALWMHRVSPGVGLVKREDMLRELLRLYEAQGDANPEAAAQQFLSDVREHAALLLERGPGEYGFIHLTFEEYLAAVAIALQGQGDCRSILGLLEEHIGEQAWREVALLTISYIGIRQNLPRIAGEAAEGLACSSKGLPGEAAVLAGEAVLDAWPAGIPPASKEKVVKALQPAMQHPAASPDLRRRAGLALGRLGWKPGDLDEFVPVPAGKFLYGDENKEREIEYPFWVAKYPVTNLQYARFMQAGGYENQEWWSKDGWRWRTGKYDTKATEKWEKEWLSQRPAERRSQPWFWDSTKWNNPIFPVVGVCWFEAQAYCNWLAGQPLGVEVPKGHVLRLPSEAEWERAARFTDGRQYPWIGDFDFSHANVSEEPGRSDGTTAVCTYPLGQSQEGIWDLSGNVWEWTDSWYDQKQSTRVLRGGSWYSYDWFARCASRIRYFPDVYDLLVGFRVVVSLRYSDKALDR